MGCGDTTRANRVPARALPRRAGRRQGQGLGRRARTAHCRAWNAPSYQEIERLLQLLSDDARPLYRAVVGLYVYPRFVRRAVCPKCRAVKPPTLVGELHIHQNRKSATFIARMVRVPLYPVEQCDVVRAIVWLDEHWRGGVFVPDELLPLVAVA
jgi:hypothetical protein